MTNGSIQVLIVDDDRKGALLLSKALGVFGDISCDTVFSAEEMFERIRRRPYRVFLLDLNLPGMDGLGALGKLKAEIPQAQILMITGHNDIQTAVTAVKQGASQYLVKPLDVAHVAEMIRRASRESRGLPDISSLKGAAPAMIYSESSPLKKLLETVEKISVSDASVLIYGESGTGKELMARHIHLESPRAKNAFIPVNCAAIPQELMESEFFGHEKGAFTGAHEARDGFFKMADKGTLFMDEMAEMPIFLQVKLLRTLQSGEIRRIGSVRFDHVDTRIIAATGKDLQQEIQKQRFREDLYYRLNVVTLELPPLRKRKMDIPLLAKAFLSGTENGKCEMEEKALALLSEYSWPGNIREFKNCIERLVLLSENRIIRAKDVEMDLLNKRKIIAASAPEGTQTLDEMEKIQILKALESTRGNKTQTAKMLGISLQTLYNKLNRFGIS